MSRSGDAFDRFLTESIAPFLLDRGFRPRQHTYWKQNDGTWTALQFHRSPDDRQRFTIKLLVASDRLRPEAPSRSRPPRADTALTTTFLEQLYGLKVRGYRDRAWWTLNDPHEQVAAQVVVAIEDQALPFLARFSDDSAIVDDVEARLAEGRFTISLPALSALASPLGRSNLVTRAKQLALDRARSGPDPVDDETLRWLETEGFALADVQVPGSFDRVILEYVRAEARVRMTRDRGFWIVDVRPQSRSDWTAIAQPDLKSIASAVLKAGS
jgi:Domain of unknown function (DUF4304)